MGSVMSYSLIAHKKVVMVCADVTTFEVNGLHVGISFPRLLVNEQGFTCTSIISSSEFRFQTNIESLVPVVATGIHPTKDLGINVNPGYVLFSQDTYNRSGIQFLCTSNFESSDTQAFRWSMESKKTGHELFDDDLTILIERQISIQVNTSSKQSILTLEGLDFPSVPDDFIVTCSSRLNDGTTPVSASSTIRINSSDDSNDKVVVILCLAVSTALLLILSIITCGILYCVCKKSGKKPRDENDRGGGNEYSSGRPPVASRHVPDVTQTQSPDVPMDHSTSIHYVNGRIGGIRR
ncbi:hypothetical protein BSL78_22745 [Apostichopus japonicus]|uniref:Uncharacterized protein n=1 Tax=Stichopus japonicus TaxID=307972 RepID=A0A2G8JXC5_STIJA|nr:hypothetical protein BSL78_22745 [Apostichopus japonicus]